jgi:hypothetical protein
MVVLSNRQCAARNRRAWAAGDDAVMRARYPHEPTARLALTLGRTERAVYARAKHLGLEKSAAYLASPCACRIRPGSNQGGATRFKPGQPSWNKGTSYQAGGRAKETQFKPGNRSGKAALNWRPIGTIAVDSEGYQRIKVREAERGEAYGFGNTRVWPLLNRHLWAQAHGPIPPGHSVVFKDGNRANCVIENLELVSRADLMRRNTVHNLPAPLPQTIQLLGALRRQIRRRDRGQEQDRRSA